MARTRDIYGNPINNVNVTTRGTQNVVNWSPQEWQGHKDKQFRDNLKWGLIMCGIFILIVLIIFVSFAAMR